MNTKTVGLRAGLTSIVFDHFNESDQPSRIHTGTAAPLSSVARAVVELDPPATLTYRVAI